MKHVYVVATSQKEADALAEEHGHESREDAQLHLIDVKRPPTNSFYANQYGIYVSKVNV